MNEAAKPAILRLAMPARPEYLVLGRLVLTGISRAHPIEPDALSDLKLALTEACSNSMRHGYATSAGIVDVRYELGEGYIAVEVSDDGPGFNEPASSPDGIEGLDEGGLGLAIIRAMSDAVELGRRADGTGSRLRFVKRVD